MTTQTQNYSVYFDYRGGGWIVVAEDGTETPLDQMETPFFLALAAALNSYADPSTDAQMEAIIQDAVAQVDAKQPSPSTTPSASTGTAAGATGGGASTPSWWDSAWGPFPTKEVDFQSVPDYATALAIAKYLTPSLDEGQALQGAIAQGQQDIVAASAPGHEAELSRLIAHQADLKAQYDSYKQSIQPKKEAVPLPPGEDRVISEGGYDWAYDPATGDWTDRVGKTPAEVKRTTEQQIDDYMAAGNWDAAMNLQTMKDWVQSPKGLTPDQIASYALNLGVAPDEWRSWYEALSQDYNAAQGKPTPPPQTADQKNAAVAAGTLQGFTAPAQQDTSAFFADLSKQLGVPPPAFGAPVTAGMGGSSSLAPPVGTTHTGPPASPVVTPPGGAPQSAFLAQNARNGTSPNVLPTLPGGAGTPVPDRVAGLAAFTASGITPEQLADMPEPYDVNEAARKSQGLPYSVKDRYTGGRGYIFKPTPDYQTRAAYAADMPQGGSSFTAQTTTPRGTTSAFVAKPVTTPTPSAFQADQVALWKSGNQAAFEQGLFGTPKPLSAEDALQQIAYRKWQKQQQSAFLAKPVRTAVFR